MNKRIAKKYLKRLGVNILQKIEPNDRFVISVDWTESEFEQFKDNWMKLTADMQPLPKVLILHERGRRR